MTSSSGVLRPTNAGEMAVCIRDAVAHGQRLRISGAGTWLDAGFEVPSTAQLSTGAMRGITDYNPDDLTLTVGAGTTLAEIHESTRVHDQWCPLFPWGDDSGTIGATVATATAGPFSGCLGRPRDHVLGVECVDGTGRVISAGGRVVKNVAGFDLTRAVIGSWGTLAVITRIHLRVRSLPVADETWALSSDHTTGERVREFARGPYSPLGCDLLTPEDATTLAVSGARWLVRIAGNPAFVAAARGELRSIGDAVEVDTAVWDRVRVRLAPADRASSWRWNVLALRLRARFDPAGVLNPGILGAEE